MESTGSGQLGRFDAGEKRGVEKESLQELLATAIGAYVIGEFLIGTQNIIIKQGILSMVGNSFLVLHHQEDDTYLFCDIFTLKFMTIQEPANRRD